MGFASRYWQGRCTNKKELIDQLCECVGGSAHEQLVVNSQGKKTRRIIIENENSADN